MRKITPQEVEAFVADQLQRWPDAAARFAALAHAATKAVDVDGFDVTVQYNPSRIRSSAAKVDKASIAARPCFLCDENRPAEQSALDLGDYNLLVNPFPIFSFHLTIVAHSHTPQLIAGRLADMARMAYMLDDSVIFYNGPLCGASAPDHMHFQAVKQRELPLISALEQGRPLPFGVAVFSGDVDFSAVRAEKFMQSLARENGAKSVGMSQREGSATVPAYGEAMVNILSYRSGDRVKIVIIPRRAHRPDFYGDGEGRMLTSPASIDLGGVMVAPRQQDFDMFDAERIRELYRQLCYDQATVDSIARPTLAVGIVRAESVDIDLISGFETNGSLHFDKADLVAAGGCINLKSTDNQGVFEIKNVVIGIGFHWERSEDQRFIGSIRLLLDGDNVVVVNDVDVEDYLRSVISSEMSATASLELLKAHAVVSRSWVLSQIYRRKRMAAESVSATGPDSSHADGAVAELTATDGEVEEIVKWYDREDHVLFDVCADDHCQRYQGLLRQTTPAVAEAIAATEGMLLTSDGAICDARFSKCCGGVTEVFSSCWEDEDVKYLQAVADKPDETDFPDLADEREAARWIDGSPEAFCNTADHRILSQVLNSYDRETADFYRWSVVYDSASLGELVKSKSGIDLGRIIDLRPLSRGRSGRITRLEVAGEKRRVIVGKELEIRKWLSPSHLYSSAFTVVRDGSAFTLRGAGWGHGVGLCQIGAAVMADKGYDYRQILNHYYKDVEIEKIY